MSISLILAKSTNDVIGYNNALLWHLPADLQHFKNITMGKPIIMGRKTFDSIGKPLPGRRNIVISRDKTLLISGCDVLHSLDAAIQLVKTEKEIMMIGGANLFLQTLPLADKIYLTLIEKNFDGDAFFPALNQAEWMRISDEPHAPDDKNKYAYRFQVWIRAAE